MSITGIICEYNPFHKGHGKQIRFLKDQKEAVVCLMSGNFVQRGAPAIFDKMTRAKAAVDCGADLVLELPVQYALSSAEGFAYGGVEVLSKLCDQICFGAENADKAQLMALSQALLSVEFSEALRQFLDQGLSFPAARGQAIRQMGLEESLLQTPNNILAVESCKAILAQNSSLTPLPIHRGGNYHDSTPDDENPSATALRILIQNGENWEDFVPKPAFLNTEVAPIHTTAQGEKAILSRLRTMTDGEFEALPFGSEGLWRKLMHAAREKATVEEIATATKSKRYTRSRIDRMILCAFLGLTQQDLSSPAPYCRVLAFNDTGREILKQHREEDFFVNIGTDTGHPYQQIERRCTSLYGLFAQDPQIPNAEENYRIYYEKR